MTTQPATDTGPAPASVSGQPMRPFRRTRHRLSSVVYTPASDDFAQITRGMADEGWIGGYHYRAPTCGATTTWRSRCQVDDAEAADLEKQLSGAPWRWLEAHVTTQVYGVCADLKDANTPEKQARLKAAAVRGLDQNLDNDLEYLYWTEATGSPLGATGPEILTNNGAPFTPLQAADFLNGYLQCSTEQLVVHTTGTLASLWGRHNWLTRNARQDLETMVGGHLVSAGCYPAWLGPDGYDDLPAFTAGAGWVSVSARPHVRIGGVWDEDEIIEPQEITLPGNRLEYRAERSIAIDADCCNRLVMLVQHCEPDEAPLPGAGG